MSGELAALLDKARRSLNAARADLRRGDFDFAGSRAYYAMFHAATAALRTRHLTFTRHTAVVGAFGREFVATGTFTPEHHAALRDAFEIRQLADYGPGLGIPEDRARQIVERADSFVRDVEAHLRTIRA